MQDIGHDHTRGRDRSLQGPGTCRRRYRCPHIPDILLPQPVTRSPQKVGLYFIIEPLHLERVEDLISRITPITLPICPTATPINQRRGQVRLAREHAKRSISASLSSATSSVESLKGHGLHGPASSARTLTCLHHPVYASAAKEIVSLRAVRSCRSFRGDASGRRGRKKDIHEVKHFRCISLVI